MKGRESDADVVDEACLTTTDLAEEWGDERTTVRDVLRESKAIFGIEEGAGFAVHRAASLEQSRMQSPRNGLEEGRRQRALFGFEDDGFVEDEELGIDVEPDLRGEVEQVHLRGSMNLMVGVENLLH